MQCLLSMFSFISLGCFCHYTLLLNDGFHLLRFTPFILYFQYQLRVTYMSDSGVVIRYHCGVWRRSVLRVFCFISMNKGLDDSWSVSFFALMDFDIHITTHGFIRYFPWPFLWFKKRDFELPYPMNVVLTLFDTNICISVRISFSCVAHNFIIYRCFSIRLQ